MNLVKSKCPSCLTTYRVPQFFCVDRVVINCPGCRSRWIPVEGDKGYSPIVDPASTESTPRQGKRSWWKGLSDDTRARYMERVEAENQLGRELSAAAVKRQYREYDLKGLSWVTRCTVCLIAMILLAFVVGLASPAAGAGVWLFFATLLVVDLLKHIRINTQLIAMRVEGQKEKADGSDS